MYKLRLHHSERKSIEEIDTYMAAHPLIAKQFESHMVEKEIDGVMQLVRSWCFVSEDQDCPDLLVRKSKLIPVGETIWNDHCAFEFKFGQDLVQSLNKGLGGLEDELTRMKLKYISGMGGYVMRDGIMPIKSCIPLYLVIVQEWHWVDVKDVDGIEATIEQPVIPPKECQRATTIAQNLNIRVIYCDKPATFATNVFKAIRTPPKEVDLGQRFVKKSSGSEFNRSLQAYHGVTKEVADKIETKYKNWDQLTYGLCVGPKTTRDKLTECFTTESGRFMQANMAKFLRKVSGQ